jgi:hypothetical protein
VTAFQPTTAAWQRVQVAEAGAQGNPPQTTNRDRNRPGLLHISRGQNSHRNIKEIQYTTKKYGTTKIEKTTVSARGRK